MAVAVAVAVAVAACRSQERRMIITARCQAFSKVCTTPPGSAEMDMDMVMVMVMVMVGVGVGPPAEWCMLWIHRQGRRRRLFGTHKV